MTAREDTDRFTTAKQYKNNERGGGEKRNFWGTPCVSIKFLREKKA
jgi:hypothetical protein